MDSFLEIRPTLGKSNYDETFNTVSVAFIIIIKIILQIIQTEKNT